MVLDTEESEYRCVCVRARARLHRHRRVSDLYNFTKNVTKSRLFISDIVKPLNPIYVSIEYE